MEPTLVEIKRSNKKMGKVCLLLLWKVKEERITAT